jgi:glycosyltransferase involved in cell wall biosynthesis
VWAHRSLQNIHHCGLDGLIPSSAFVGTLPVGLESGRNLLRVALLHYSTGARFCELIEFEASSLAGCLAGVTNDPVTPTIKLITRGARKVAARIKGIMLINDWISEAHKRSARVPAVSICIPVYNGERFLHRALDGLAQQTFQDFEVVLVDDGSRDETAAKARALLDHYGMQGRVLVTRNRGCEQARDLACSLARSGIIAPFDCDDSWKRTYLQEMLSALQSNKKIGLVYCDFVEEFTATGRTELKSAAATWIDLSLATRTDDLYQFPRGAFFTMLLRGQVLFPPCTMFRRELFEKVGRYSGTLPDLRISLDWSFGLRAARAGTIAFLKRPLLRKYVHGENVSGDLVKTAASSVTVLESMLSDATLAPDELILIRQGIASRLRSIAYERWDARRERWAAFALALKSMRYQWSKRSVVIALLTMLPFSVVDLLRRFRSRGAGSAVMAAE